MFGVRKMKKSAIKAILIALATGKERPEEINEHLEELSFLAETAGIVTNRQFIQRLPHPDTRTFLGKGKLEEVKSYAFAQGIDVIIFDDDLSPSQLRNLERSSTRKAAKPK